MQLHKRPPNKANFNLRYHLTNLLSCGGILKIGFERGMSPGTRAQQCLGEDADGQQELIFSLAVIQVQMEGLECEWDVFPLSAAERHLLRLLS